MGFEVGEPPAADISLSSPAPLGRAKYIHGLLVHLVRVRVTS